MYCHTLTLRIYLSFAEDVVSSVIIVKPKYSEPGFARSRLDIKENLFSALNSTSINNTSSSEIALLLNTRRGQFQDFPCVSVHITQRWGVFTVEELYGIKSSFELLTFANYLLMYLLHAGVVTVFL